jgi:hypothetical protein
MINNVYAVSLRHMAAYPVHSDRHQPLRAFIIASG